MMKVSNIHHLLLFLAEATHIICQDEMILTDTIICQDEMILTDTDILTELNPEYTRSGEKIIQGDIVLPPSDDENDIENRKGTANILSLWFTGQVSYNFHSSVSDETRIRIREAMDHWEENTCLKFHERIIDVFYLRFRTDTDGCWSYIGRSNNFFRGQDVSIGQGCEQVSVIIHEIGHAIGFYHEQSRNDRDRYITILWNNMKSGMRAQFDKGMDAPRGVEYDYTSVMHYGAMAFSNRVYEKNTIVTKNPHYQRFIGTRRGLTFRDAKMANVLYSCNMGCPNNSSEEFQCQNGGYLGPNRRDGNPCPCICPPETTGQFCETLIGNYYAEPPCGGNITEEMEFQTPGYPQRERGTDDSCSWWIQAPDKHLARVEFLDFSFRPRMQSTTRRLNNKCVYERVEIRANNLREGNMYCGEDLPKRTVVTSNSGNLIIIISSNTGSKVGRGLHAKVSFVQAKSVVPSWPWPWAKKNEIKVDV